MQPTSTVANSVGAKPPLTRNQRNGFLAAWGGWALDGMDSFIYALVLVPAMRELLPKSGIAPTPANIASYGAILFSLFLVGWGLALIWGPIADRFGRVRTLMGTILFFSFFTFMSAFATNLWALAIYRLLAGMGIGSAAACQLAISRETTGMPQSPLGGGCMTPPMSSLPSSRIRRTPNRSQKSTTASRFEASTLRNS